MPSLHDDPSRIGDGDSSVDQIVAPEGWANPVAGMLLTVVLTACAMPVSLFAIFMLLVSAENHDTSGQGGPFRSCGPMSSECDGGDPSGVILWGLVIVVTVAGIGFAGRAVGRHSSSIVGRVFMGVLSAILVTATAVAVWVALVHR